ncbi:MAG: hypothetical protein CMF69_00870 [Magnetovibrio sp.]|nr:hypothetical protein [Magnetovibrio sp.]
MERDIVSIFKTMTKRSKTQLAQIPILDLSDYLNGKPDAQEELAIELRAAMEDTGFYILVNHGIGMCLIEKTLEAAKQFHAQPYEVKMALKGNEHNVGYMPLNSSVSRASQIDIHEPKKPNLVEAFFVKRELHPKHPDVLANKLYRSKNIWPDELLLPGFRSSVIAYCHAMEDLCQRMLPIYAIALNLPSSHFDEPFTEATFSFRMSHYPPTEFGDQDQFGISAHTDSSFLTMLPQGDLPGLEVRLPGQEWQLVIAPEGSIVVNSGDMMRRWTNHRFLSTPHRAINRNYGKDRYAIPFFFDANVDYPMACLPTCHSPDNPPRYAPITYTEYMKWFSQNNYDHVRNNADIFAPNPGVPPTQSVRD